MIDEEEFTKRTQTLDSHFFDEYSIKNYSKSKHSCMNDFEDMSYGDLNNYRGGMNSSNVDSELMM